MQAPSSQASISLASPSSIIYNEPEKRISSYATNTTRSINRKPWDISTTYQGHAPEQRTLHQSHLQRPGQQAANALDQSNRASYPPARQKISANLLFRRPKRYHQKLRSRRSTTTN